MSDAMSDIVASNKLDKADKEIEKGNIDKAKKMLRNMKHSFHYGKTARRKLKELNQNN